MVTLCSLANRSNFLAACKTAVFQWEYIMSSLLSNPCGGAIIMGFKIILKMIRKFMSLNYCSTLASFPEFYSTHLHFQYLAIGKVILATKKKEKEKSTKAYQHAHMS